MDDVAAPAPEPPAEDNPKPGLRWPRVVLSLGLVLILAAAAVTSIVLWPRSAEPVAASTPVATSGPQPPVPGSTPSPVAAADMSPQDLAERYGDSVWKVESEGCGFLSTGTAFAVGPRTLVTNAHVIANDTTPQVLSRDGQQTVTTTVVGADENLDVAVLVTEQDLDGESLAWADANDLAEGQDVVALGYPVPDHSFTVVPATIMSFQTDGDTRQALRLDGLVDKGNSGGPALTSAGEVAGVVTYLLAEGVQWIPVAHTHDYLAETVDEIERDRPGSEVNCDPPAPAVPEGWDEDWDDIWEDDWGQGLPAPEDAAPNAYGDDASLDALHDACGAGDMVACDDLYWNSPYGSPYEQFATTCGDTETEPTFGGCALPDALPDEDVTPEESDVPDEPDVVDEPEMPDEPMVYGDDSDLDALYDACSAGDMVACDNLYLTAPVGSEYEEFGMTCGGIDEGYGVCSFDYEQEWSDQAAAYGDDAHLDGLWDECADGELSSCDDLYLESGWDTEYEEFGSTCGERSEHTYGTCDW